MSVTLESDITNTVLELLNLKKLCRILCAVDCGMRNCWEFVLFPTVMCYWEFSLYRCNRLPPPHLFFVQILHKFWEVFDSSTYMRIIISGKCIKREVYGLLNRNVIFSVFWPFIERLTGHEGQTPVFLYSRANLWYTLQWLVDVLWVDWICSLSGEGCTPSRNVGLLIVVCGCQTSIVTVQVMICALLCVVSAVSCHQTGKSLNLTD